MTAGARVLLLPAAIGQSHLTRLVLIARALRARGAAVVFGFRDDSPILRAEGFERLPVADATVTDFGGNVFAAYTPALIEQCLAGERRAIEATQPDAVVADLRLTAAISARLAGRSLVSVVNGYLTAAFDPTDVLLPARYGRLRHAVASAVGRLIQHRQKRAVAAAFRVAARRYGLAHLTTLDNFLRGDLTLIADLPEYCPLPKLPADHQYIGPLIWDGPAGPPPPPLPAPPPGRLPIYATTGNTGSRRLAELVADAFGGRDEYAVLLTTGAYLDPDTVPRAPNIRVERFVPGSAAMAWCAAAIHCGGNGTTYQALAAGVPALAVPFTTDQVVNAWLLARAGAGWPLQPATLTGERLRAALHGLLADATVRRALDRFRTRLAATDGPAAAAEAILARRPAPHPPSSGGPAPHRP